MSIVGLALARVMHLSTLSQLEGDAYSSGPQHCALSQAVRRSQEALFAFRLLGHELDAFPLSIVKLFSHPWIYAWTGGILTEHVIRQKEMVIGS